jgi:high-affinity nickel-transport protein
MLDALLGYALGLLHGVRHAFEPDHVAAVSTMIAEQRSAKQSMRFAVAWGAGHALTLLVVGGLLFATRARMPARLADAFELAVAVMLVALGARAIALAAKTGGRGAATPHAHRGVVHTHATGGDHVHARGWTFARRPLLVGLVHGLAGSGALAAMVMSELPSAGAGIAFMALYGAGATCGMAALAGVAGVPLARMARMPRVLPALVAITGVVSVGLGVAWGAPIVARLVAAGV